jgi:flagellar assembly factor FliW
MKIKNKQFGEIEFQKESIFEFEEGILGFEERKRFLLISENEGFFFWLTSVDEPELIFPLFSIKLLQEKFSNQGELEPYGIVKLDKDPEKVSINLKAPVFINHEKKTGYQKIMDKEEYPVDYPLFVKNEKL